MVVATGFFDGVHVGHRLVIQQLTQAAAVRGDESMVITFWPHPRNVLQKEARSLRLLTTLAEKKEMLHSLGVDKVEVLNFTKDFSALTMEDYLRLLMERYGAKTILLGYDNKMGSDASGAPLAEGTRVNISLTAVPHYYRRADGSYPFEVGIATIPQVSADNKKVISQGPSVCIFKKSNPQEVIASWLFVKYLTTTVEFQAAFSMTSGYVPVLKSVADNKIYADFLAKANGTNYVTALSAKVCLEQADAYYVSPAFNGSSTARDEVGALMVACLTGKWADSEVDAKIRQVFADAIDECEYWG